MEGGGRREGGDGGVMEGGRGGMEEGKRGEEGWKGVGGEGREAMEGGGAKEGGGEMEEGGEMEGGDSEAHSPGLVVAPFRSFRLRPCAVVFVRRGRVLGARHSCMGVVVVRVVVCGRSCRPWGWVAVAVLGAVLSFVGSALSFVGGVRSWAVYVRGWGGDLRGLWLSYTRGVGAVVGH